MSLNGTKNLLQMNWMKLKSKLPKHWGRISNDDLAQINGNSEELIKILRKKYGYGKAQAEIEIESWLKQQSE